MASTFLDRRRRIDSASDSETLPSTECGSPSDSKRVSGKASADESDKSTNKFSRFIDSLEKDKTKPTNWGKPRKGNADRKGKYVRKEPQKCLFNPYAAEFKPIRGEFNPDASEFCSEGEKNALKMADSDQTPVWVLAAAFFYLNGFDLLLNLSLVNRVWKQATESQELWEYVVRRDFFALDLEGNEGGRTDRKTYIKLLCQVKNPESLFRMQQSSLSMYSLVSNALTQREDDRFASSGRFCVTASGTLVITGGKQNEGRKCYIYSPTSNAFSVLPSMREHREYHGMCLWNASVVVSGGYEMQSEQSEVYTNTAEQLWNGVWRPLAPMQCARAYHTLVSAQHQVFAVAGMNTEVGYLDSIECWEFDHWRVLSVTLPEAISDPTAKFMYPSTILVLGGMHEFGFLDSAVELDFEAGSIQTYKLPVEVYTGNNCITRRGNQLIVFNTLREVVKLTYERGVRLE